MSTILKALRRLEREKTRADRPLREQVTGPDGEGPDEGNPPRRWPTLLGGIGAGIVAGLAVLYLLLGQGDSRDETLDGAPVAGVVAVSPQAPPARRAMPPAARAPRPAPPPRSEPVADADPEPLDEVAVIDRGAPPPRIAEESAPAPSPAEPPPGSVRPFEHADPQQLPRRHLPPHPVPEGDQPAARAAAAPPALPPEPVPAPAPAPPAPEAAQAEPAREADPELAPKAPKASPPKAEPASPPKAPAVALPALRVEHTTWHPIAERRVAVVELPGGGTQSVHEGELVAGALVKRIEPSGVVFEQAGRELRRKVGEGP